MSDMRWPWQGRVFFENAQRGHFTGTAHLYDEALSKTVAPYELREDESRWWFVGREYDADSLQIGYNGWSEWPNNVMQGLQWIAHSLLRDRLAVIEWGIVEGEKYAVPKLHMLPAWSCRVKGHEVYQRQSDDGHWTHIERGVAISLTAPLQEVMDREIRSIVELEQHHRQAMMMTGPAILGQTKVNVLGVMHEVDTRLWEATRESGFLPPASMLQLSPAYRALRRTRFEFFCQRVRHSILRQLDSILQAALRETGRGLTIGYEEGWDEDEEAHLVALALGSDEDRANLDEIFQPARAARRARIRAAMAEQAENPSE